MMLKQHMKPGDLVLLSTPYSVRVPTFSNPCGETGGTVRQHTLAIVLATVATATFYEGTTQRTTAYKMHLVVVNGRVMWVIQDDVVPA